ncbi:MAG TPA: putative metal-binding motif-containing protein [Candidatus Nanoarchaeia archaeon]|nr:putative metal-binding motif-containing protein [Candidatus Nanoarchaeia archaeon]
MKRSSKNLRQIFFLVSIVLILSISIISAASFIEVLGRIFGIPITGNAAGGEICTDSDGYEKFDVAGWVLWESVYYYDSCSGNIANDYYCDKPSAPPITGEIVASITGNPISGSPPPIIAKNCATSGFVCYPGGVCGCDNDEMCATSINSPTKPACSNGNMVCTNGNLGPCVPPSTAETCDGIDNDCDAVVDDGACPSGQTCDNIQGTWACRLGVSCTDADGDKYNVSKTGCGTQFDCNDSNANINPGKSEGTVCNRIDDNCNGFVDEGISCNPQVCNDTDGDFYGNPTIYCTFSELDCNNNNAAINPGATESCTDKVDNNCNSLTDCADSFCNGKTCETGKTCQSGMCSSIPLTPECSDSIDNDGDGKIDYPADTGCTSASDTDESNCGDGKCEGGETSISCSTDCPCTPDSTSTTCTNKFGSGYQCGTATNNCGQTVSCGSSTATCTSPFGTCIVNGTKTCNAQGQYGSCVATDPRPGNCVGKSCGSDQCGGYCGTLPLGACSPGQNCNPSSQVCEGPCGGQVCAQGQECLQMEGRCCTPKTIAEACYNQECGTANNSCGGTVFCGPSALLGACPSGESCTNGQCIQNAQPCKDADGDGYVEENSNSMCIKSSNFSGYGDCREDNKNIYPTAQEICNGINDNCNNETDEGLYGATLKCAVPAYSIANEGGCMNTTTECRLGTNRNTCESNGLKTPSSSETLDDKIDNDCNGLVDEGGKCTSGQNTSCDTGNPCTQGVQRCVNRIYSSTCEVVNTLDDCDPDSACSPGTPEICGTDVGNCIIGKKTCQSDRTWGECSDVKPEAEVCDGDDNDCNGLDDEDGVCDTGEDGDTDTDGNDYDNFNDDGSGDNSVTGDSNDDGSSSEEGGKVGENFLSKFLKWIAAVLQIGRTLIGGAAISEPQNTIVCSDPDGGDQIFVKGIGKGLSNNDEELWFQDTCYKGSLSNQLEKCAGEDCFLLEYSCNKDGKHFSSRPEIKCQFGCSKGACIPTGQESDDCQERFDEVTLQWIDPC